MNGTKDFEIDKDQFEFDMLTFIHLHDKPYDEAVREARKEFKELKEDSIG